MSIFSQKNKTRATDAYEDSKFLRIISWTLFTGLCAALITVAIVNIKPYVIIMAGASANATWIYEFPIVGPILKSLSVGVSLIAAFLVWAVVQILQTLWLLIALDAKAQKAALRQAASLSREMSEFKKDGNEARTIAKKIARIPFFFTKWSALLALGAYSFDAVVGMSAYPVWKDWDTFMMWSKSMSPLWINFDNLRDLVIMLFSFEAVLILTIICWQWISLRKDGDADA